MTVYNVETRGELLGALDGAEGGDTVRLEGGDYGRVTLRGLDFTSDVTITSADAGDPAVFDRIKTIHSSNLVFDDIRVELEPTAGTVEWSSAVKFYESSDIELRDSVIEGGDAVAGVSPDAERGEQGKHGIRGEPIGRAVFMQGTRDVTLEGNDISYFKDGIVGGTGVVIRGNEIHHLRTTPIRGGGSDFLIEDNYLHSSDKWKGGGKGDHGDMIHMWTSSDGATKENIVIRDNVFSQGDGGTLMGVYLDDNRNGVGFRNIEIENNTFWNSHFQQILLENVHDGTIRDNTMIKSEGGWRNAPQINLHDGSSGLTIEDNITAGITGAGDPGERGNHLEGNLTLQYDDPSAENFFGRLFYDGHAATGDEALGLRAVRGSPADGIGASRTQFDDDPAAQRPLFELRSASRGDGETVLFDARDSYGPDGPLRAGDATFIWDFGDGASATGRQVQHAYAAPGRYEARLEIAGPGGATASAEATVAVAGAEILSFDPADGLFHTHGYGESAALGSSARGTVATATGQAIDLGGEGVTAAVDETQIARFFGAGSFEMSMTLTADARMGSAGEVARIHNSLVLEVERSGALHLRLSPTSGAVDLTTTRTSITDGAAHDVTIRLDGSSDTLDILVDGRVAASETVTGSIRTEDARTLLFGNPWGHQNFEGKLSAFSLSAPASDYPVAEGNLADLPESSTPPAPDEDALTSPPDPEEGGIDAAAGGDVGETGDGETGDAITRSELGTAVRQHFDGTGEFADLGRIEAFEDSEQLSYEVTFHRDDPGAETERLVWNHIKTGLALEGDTLKVYANRAGTPFHEAFEIADAGVADTEQHTARVILDAEADRVQVILDDEVVLDDSDSDIDFVGAGGHEWGWMLGTPWNRYFEGEVSEFAVDDSAGFVEPDAPGAPFEGTLLVA